MSASVVRAEAPPGFALSAAATPDLAAFLDSVLRSGRGVSTTEDLPLLFGDDPRAFRRTATDEDGRVVAHAAGYVHDVLVRPKGGVGPSPKRRIAVIAGVATAPDRRRLGLATRVLEGVLEEAAARGADAAVLWSEADALYVKLGFSPAGSECVLVAEAGFDEPPARGVVRPMSPADLDAVRALHDAEPARVVRDRRTWEILLAVPPTTAAW